MEINWNRKELVSDSVKAAAKTLHEQIMASYDRGQFAAADEGSVDYDRPPEL